MKSLIKSYRAIAQTIPTKPKVLVNMKPVPHTSFASSSVFRKEIVRELRKVAEDPGFEKAALWGAGVLQRTVAKFILAASGLKNIKYFKTEKESIRWLKEN